MLPAVCATPRSTSERTPWGSWSARPMICNRILLRWMTGSSFLRYSRRRRIRKSISALGRRQFSSENAYRVSAGICRRAQVSITARADFTPARCPAMRGRWRRWAQRPLPSMMMATWRGRRRTSSCSSRRASSRLADGSSSGGFTLEFPRVVLMSARPGQNTCTIAKLTQRPKARNRRGWPAARGWRGYPQRVSAATMVPAMAAP